MSNLFDSISFRGLTLPNRIGMPPMCMYHAEAGYPNEWHRTHYASRAAGGTGLIIVEATAVESRGRISPRDLGIWDDSHVDAFRTLVDAVHAQGAKIVLQIAHAGRKAGTVEDNEGLESLGPSPKLFSGRHRMPRELKRDEIVSIQDAFAAAAKRALAAGFDTVEIHGAHGYLVSSFLSPLANERFDEYGGGFEGRTKFLLETTRKVREVLSEDKPLFVRLSCIDWHDKGWQLDDTIRLVRLLKEEGVDLVDCSSGGNDPEVTAPVSQDAESGYQVPFAEAVRRETGMPTAAVGLITEPKHAESIVGDEKADLVLLGRELLRNPAWGHLAAWKLGYEDRIPRQYRRAFERIPR